MSLIVIAIALAAPATASEAQFMCVFQSDQGSGPVEPKRIEIILSGPTPDKLKTVRFEGETALLDDDYGNKPAGRRRWNLKLTAFTGSMALSTLFPLPLSPAMPPESG